MFGYVTVNQAELSPEAFARYRSYYCGLCHRLDALHGFSARALLSYDMTFLALLLDGLYEPEQTEGKARCAPHPLRAHAFTHSHCTDYAADMGIELAYRKFLDNWEDDRSPTSLVLAKTLGKKHLALAEKYPRQCSSVHLCLSKLQRGEQAGCTDPDEMSSYFGAFLAELFTLRRDEWLEPLQEIGMNLGKFIYLMDAYTDFDKDQKKGCYNPLTEWHAQPDYEARCRETLTLLMAQAAGAFERLPILRNADVLRNILYSGVWARYNALQPKPNTKKEPNA